LKQEVIDYIVIGGGFAGISAALTLSQSRHSVMLLEFHRDTDAVGDFPRVQSTFLSPPTTGASFSEAMGALLNCAGVERRSDCYIMGVRPGRQVVVDCIESRWSCKGAVFAPNGTEPGLHVAGSERLHGFGVSYSASSDAHFYASRRVAVYGDAPRVIEHAWIAAQYASEVVVLVKGNANEGNSELLTDLRSSPKVTFHEGASLKALHATSHGTLDSVEFDYSTVRRSIEVAALFVAQHAVPAFDVVGGGAEIDRVVFAGLAAGTEYWKHADLVADGARAAHVLLAQQ
jgi:thioredoxin reductase